MSNPEEIAAICPYMGLKCDVQTRFSVPDEQHVCHQTKSSQAINMEYQGRCCLTTEYRACQGYITGWNHGLPRGVRQKVRRHAPHGFRVVVQTITLTVLVVSLFYLFLEARAALPGPVQALPVTVPAPTATWTPTPTATATLTPSETPTPPPGTPTAGPLAETPFGPEGNWLIHQVQRGESLELIAQQYDTTVAVLRAINIFTNGGVWAETPMVVCRGCLNAADLPVLKPLQVIEKINVNDLSLQYGMDPYDFRMWNGIVGEWVEAGRWVVVAGS